MSKDNFSTSKHITLFDGDVQHLFKQGAMARPFEVGVQSSQETYTETFDISWNDDLLIQ